MAAGGGSIQWTSPVGEQWSESDLPADVLGMVYIRFVCPTDRVRFAAVCSSWRAVASTHPPPPVLPWLMLDPRGGDDTKHLYCPDDGTVLPRVPLPSNAAGRCFIGSHDGGWVASSEAPLGIVNLFSGAEVPLSAEQRRIVRERQCTGDLLVLKKIIFSEAPTSSDCILAAITDKLGIAICKVGCPEKGWITPEFRWDDRLMDIAFCNGELYGLMRYGDKLVRFEITMDDGAPVRIDAHRLNMERRDNYHEPEEQPRYILELHGKLLMAKRTRTHRWWWQGNNYRCFFTVEELVGPNADTAMDLYDYKWVEKTSLGDYALFIGPTCSKAVLVPTDARGGGLQRNHIYYSHHRCLRRKDDIPAGAKLFLTSSDSNGDRLYYVREESTDDGDVVEGIMSAGYYVRSGLNPPMWLLPPNI